MGINKPGTHNFENYSTRTLLKRRGKAIKVLFETSCTQSPDVLVSPVGILYQRSKSNITGKYSQKKQKREHWEACSEWTIRSQEDPDYQSGFLGKELLRHESGMGVGVSINELRVDCRVSRDTYNYSWAVIRMNCTFGHFQELLELPERLVLS